MKSASGGFASHMGREVTAFKTLWRVTRRDGQKFHFTDNNRDLRIDPAGGNAVVTFKAAGGYTRSSIMNTASLAVDNLDISSHLDPNFTDITERDVRAGLFDFAQIEMWMVVFLDTSLGVVPLRRGYLGEVSLRDDIYFAEFRGLVQLLTQSVVEVYSPQCRADLGDARCKVPISPLVVLRGTAYAVGTHVRASAALEGLTDPTLLVHLDTDLVDSGPNAAVGSLNPLTQLQSTTFLLGTGAMEMSPTGITSIVGAEFTSIPAYAVGAGAFTIEAFVRFKSNTGIPQVIMSKHNPSPNRGWFFQCNLTAGTIAWFGFTDGSSTFIGTNPSFAFVINTWYHVAVTRDGSNNMRFFVNGTQVGSTTVQAGSIFESGQPLRLGRYNEVAPSDLVRPLDGFIDEARFVKGVALYTTAFTPPAAPIVTFSEQVALLVTSDYADVTYTCKTAGTTATLQPTYDTTVGNDTTDGTAVFTAGEAWTRAATVLTVTDNKQFTISVNEPRAVDGWFQYGAVGWDTGNNADLPPMEVKDWLASVSTGTTTLGVADANSFSRATGSFITDGFKIGMKITTSGFTAGGNNGTFTVSAVNALTLDVSEGGLSAESGTGDEAITSHGAVTLFLGMPFAIQVGDTLSIYRGCDKSTADCNVFANVVNYRGEPFVPGTDALIRAPDAPQG